MLKILKKQGFASLIEVLVTTVIFALAAIGILSTVSMLRPKGMTSARDLKAAYIGKQVMEDLRKDVDAQTWNSTTSNLYWGSHTQQINEYNVTYTVSPTPGSDVRQVTMNITYP